MWDLHRNTANDVNFYDRTNSVQNDNQIFQ